MSCSVFLHLSFSYLYDNEELDNWNVTCYITLLLIMTLLLTWFYPPNARFFLSVEAVILLLLIGLFSFWVSTCILCCKSGIITGWFAERKVFCFLRFVFLLFLHCPIHVLFHLSVRWILLLTVWKPDTYLG